MSTKSGDIDTQKDLAGKEAIMTAQLLEVKHLIQIMGQGGEQDRDCGMISAGQKTDCDVRVSLKVHTENKKLIR